MKTVAKLLGLAGILILTGCPYTEGCEAPAPVAGETEAGPIDPATPDGGTDPDPDGLAAIPLGPILPACAGLAATCAGGSCCATGDVTTGDFQRVNDPAYPAHVSAFRLDTYEVVVGRFRAFVNAGKGTKASPPAEGAGAHPLIPNSGWQSAWNAALTDDKAALVDAVRCDPELYHAYEEMPGVNDTLPMNCTTWYEAQAFCIWDGGRLPTETEWNYAAAGGAEQRVLPWGGPSADRAHVSFGCQSGDSIADPGAPPCAFADYMPVGTHPSGNGRWGHADMAGNVWERVFDFYREPFAQPACNDCADLEATAEGRGIRGGSINWGESFQRTSDRTPVNAEPLDTRTNTVGFRCARAIP